MANLRSVTVKSSGGDYTSLNAAIVAEANAVNLVSLDRALVINCYPFTETGGSILFTTPAGGADATRQVTVRAVADHGGAWNTGAYTLRSGGFSGLGTSGIGSSYLVIDGLQIQGIAPDTNIILPDSCDHFVVKNCLLQTLPFGRGVYISSASSFGKIVNTIFFGTTLIHVAQFGAATDIQILNCTFVGGDTAIESTVDAPRVINCLFQSQTTAVTPGAVHADSSNNVTSSAAVGGSSARTLQTATFRNATLSDYHLASSDTAAKGYGRNLRNDTTWAVEDDIDRADRRGTWDVGADQYVAPTGFTPIGATAPGWTPHDVAPITLGATFNAPQNATAQPNDPFPLSLTMQFAAAGTETPDPWDLYPFPIQLMRAVTSYTLTAAVGSFALTLKPASLRAARKLPAAVRTFALTGTATPLRAARKLPAAVRTFSVTGNATGVRAARKLATAVAAFTLTGNATGLRRGYRLATAVGSFTLTGVAIALRAARRLVTAVGPFTLTGTATPLRAARRLPTAVGTFTLTGNAIGLRTARRLPTAVGAFTFTGIDVALTVTTSGVVRRVGYLWPWGYGTASGTTSDQVGYTWPRGY